jgi:hypothetical protein
MPLFNPYVKSYRYQHLEKIIKAKKYYRWPEFLNNRVDELILSGYKGTELVKNILYENNTLITTKNINKHIKNLKMKKLICLGIESTAL